MREVLFAVLLSAVFTGMKALCYLLGWCGKPGWTDFLGGALGLIAFFLLWRAGHTLYYMRLYKKNPVFREAHLNTGITWREYKKIKGI